MSEQKTANYPAGMAGAFERLNEALVGENLSDIQREANVVFALYQSDSVFSPGDLRARIEQLRLDDSDIVPGTDALITVSYNRAIADVLALLGAAQEQP